MSTLSRMHLVAGCSGLVAFLLSGAHMHFNLDHLRQMPDGTRLLYRSTHIYLFFAASINLTLGAHFMAAVGAWRRSLQAFGSSTLLIAPLLLVAAFCIEPSGQKMDRPLTRPAIYLVLLGTLLHTGLAITGKKRGDRNDIQMVPATHESGR